MLTSLVDNYRSRVALALQTTATAADGFCAPTPGAKACVVRAIATMGNAADLAISLQYADDATGTIAAAFGYNVPIYKNGVRQTDAKALTIGDAIGNFIVDFIVDPGLIPAGKFIGAAYANSDADNLLSVMVIEDVAYKPTVS